MNVPHRILLSLFALSCLGACDTEEQVIADTAAGDDVEMRAARRAVKPRGTCVTPPSDLVLWHSYDESTGPVALDYSFGSGAAHGYHVNATPGVPGMVLSALGFNGSSSSVVVDHEPAIDISTSDFAIDLWVRPDIAETNAILVSKAVQTPPPAPVGNIQEGWQLSYNGSAVFLSIADGTAHVARQLSSLATPITPGQWNFIAVNVDRQNAQARLWINGVDQGPVNMPLPLNSISTPADLTVGDAGIQHSSWNFDGDMDELELFTRQLTAAEVASLYNAGPAGKCKTCPPESATLNYASTDVEVCADSPPDVYCDPSEGWHSFDNHCGCGCIQEIEDGMQ